jgi:mitochondrial import receptor subunit TOM20
MSARTSTILTIAGVTVLSGALAYAVYFDYKRRNDAEFRKKLRKFICLTRRVATNPLDLYIGKDKKRADKAATTTASAASAFAPSGSRTEELRTALAKIRTEPLPASTTEKEQYFMSQASLGEQFCAQGECLVRSTCIQLLISIAQGPQFAVPAALAFFRALRVYPAVRSSGSFRCK